jgi:hypothetical protein
LNLLVQSVQVGCRHVCRPVLDGVHATRGLVSMFEALWMDMLASVVGKGWEQGSGRTYHVTPNLVGSFVIARRHEHGSMWVHG